MAKTPVAKILVADDEPLFLKTTGELLRKADYDCTCVPDARTALDALKREPFDLVLCDLNMPGNLDLELLRQGRENWPGIPLIVITGAPSLPTAIESVRLGITDYLLKPVSYADLLSSVRRALARPRSTPPPPGRSESQRRALAGQFPEIVGQSACMLELFDILDRVAESDTNVLITGESGTGKEVVARSIHAHGARAAQPFQVVDCTAIPETLFESILFGHAKGAFTGADRDQQGLLAVCGQGTVLFDEIGELPTILQAKLLRAMQEQTFTPLGAPRPLRFEARILCATNRDLEFEVRAGRFRRDLFYRLAVLHIELPPLRQRGEDVVLLAERFVDELCRPDAPRPSFTAEVLDCFRRYTWPGNVRELRNVVERALALARSPQIVPADLPAALRQPQRAVEREPAAGLGGVPREVALGSAEREYLEALLERFAGNVSRAAHEAGMSRQGLHKLLKKHGIAAHDFRP